jgi:L-ascorbate metabolism protein UlaG (beta-lactamase superfamily)
VKTPAELWQEIEQTCPQSGTVVLWWLYQAGVAVKTPGGATVLIDPYLSDAVMRSYGLPRAVPPPLTPAISDADALLATHSHEDHLDPDSIAPFLSHQKTRFIGPPMATDKVLATGIDATGATSVRRGDVVDVGDLSIHVVHARHMFGAEPTPDAVGYLLECDGVRIYHSGDTEYDSEIVADTPDVTAALICINGTTGNMNAHEAAMLAWRQRAKVAIPFHYGLWHDQDYGEGATLDPELFAGTYRRLEPVGRVHILQPAEPVVFDASGLAG